MRDRRTGRASIPTAYRLVFGLFLLVVIGTCMMRLPWSGRGEALTWSEALFTACSALTVTGHTVITPSQALSPFGKVMLLILMQVGGIGYMVLAITAFQLIGRRISLGDRLALRDALGLISPEGIVKLTKGVFVAVLVIELLGALVLSFIWRDLFDDHRLFFFALFHSVSAFCNAGFEIFTGTAEFPNGLPLTTPGTIPVLGVLIFLGGLGIPVLYDLLTYRSRQTLSLHTQITLPFTILLFIIGAAWCFLSETQAGGVLADNTRAEQVSYSIFQSLSARSAGLGTPEFYGANPATNFMLMGLMFIGSAPASMGGGTTTGTALVLILAVWAYARGRSTPSVGGFAVQGEMVRKAAAVLTISVLTVFTSTALILLTHNLPLEPVLFDVISAFATCGLDTGVMTSMNEFGRLLIIFMMFWGRLGALTVVYVFAQRRPNERVRLPEEKILIG